MDTPKEYNATRLSSGAFTLDHVVELVREFQQSRGLRVDGKAGPLTLDELDKSAVFEETHLMLATPMLAALAVAESEIGHGEEGSNNRGPDVIRFRSGDGTGRPTNTSDPWCASFASFCIISGFRGELPDGLHTSRGAKHLADLVERYGGGARVDIPEPGALIVWHRGLGISRKGHVGLVKSYDLATDTLVTIEGNKNERGKKYALVAEFGYPRGAWRKRLYKVVAYR